jgi:DNA segregation ATPase FtsK/SpoIIIE, S-DNA-T family
VYNGIPHLITPVVTKADETVNALKWTIREMDRRFDVLSKFGARDIESYNQRSEDKIPYLVFVVDELADLMVTSASEVEGPIVRLAQMSRAVGIHLVLATQRPSVDVLTGLIKANVPARIAFAVASATDSRTILDQMGAEKLLGRGDMLFQTSDMASPKRVQGAFVTDDEVRRVVEFLKSKYGPADYDATVTESQRSGTSFVGGVPVDDDSDPLIPEAKEEILRAGKASASLLQRRLKVGYARAARLLDLLEQEGFIGPGDGAKPREILKAEFTKGMEQIPTRESGMGSGASLDVDEQLREAEIARLTEEQEADDRGKEV